MSHRTSTLNIVGCGNLGKTLAYLWNKNQQFHIAQICNTHIDSAERACQFIGAGQISKFDTLSPSDNWLIATPDEKIESVCIELLNQHLIQPGNVVFHCSGSKSTQALLHAKQIGAAVASIHPIKSFADPAQAVTDFSGTYCGTEGDASALQQLKPAFESIGGHCITINPEQKMLYHTAAVFASNYLVALIEQSIQTYEKAGIPRETAVTLLKPITTGTLNNILNHGTHHALTGPIKRGDHDTVNKQLNACQQWDKNAAEIYISLGRVALSLSQNQQDKGIQPQALQHITEIFNRANPEQTESVLSSSKDQS